MLGNSRREALANRAGSARVPYMNHPIFPKEISGVRKYRVVHVATLVRSCTEQSRPSGIWMGKSKKQRYRNAVF